MDIGKMFEMRRHHKDFHLGLGDIRLTIGDQESVAAEVERLRAENEALRKAIAQYGVHSPPGVACWVCDALAAGREE